MTPEIDDDIIEIGKRGVTSEEMILEIDEGEMTQESVEKGTSRKSDAGKMNLKSHERKTVHEAHEAGNPNLRTRIKPTHNY